MEHDMDSVLISVVVAAIFFVITATVGSRLGHTAKPYGIVKLATHIILFLLVRTYAVEGLALILMPKLIPNE
jgi:hypothetical protein